jgi:hypothetical protein
VLEKNILLLQMSNSMPEQIEDNDDNPVETDISADISGVGGEPEFVLPFEMDEKAIEKTTVDGDTTVMATKKPKMTREILSIGGTPVIQPEWQLQKDMFLEQFKHDGAYKIAMSSVDFSLPIQAWHSLLELWLNVQFKGETEIGDAMVLFDPTIQQDPDSNHKDMRLIRNMPIRDDTKDDENDDDIEDDVNNETNNDQDVDWNNDGVRMKKRKKNWTRSSQPHGYPTIEQIWHDHTLAKTRRETRVKVWNQTVEDNRSL